MRWVQLCGSLRILWHCLSLGLEWKLAFSSPVATAEFSKFAGIFGKFAVSCKNALNEEVWLIVLNLDSWVLILFNIPCDKMSGPHKALVLLTVVHGCLWKSMCATASVVYWCPWIPFLLKTETEINYGYCDLDRWYASFWNSKKQACYFKKNHWQLSWAMIKSD